MQTPPTPDPEAAPSPDKSRFKFQKLLQPFTTERGIATPIIWNATMLATRDIHSRRTAGCRMTENGSVDSKAAWSL